jgi:cell division protein DivIC
MGERSKLFDPRGGPSAGSRRQKGDIWHRLLPWAYGGVFLGILFVAGLFFWPVIERHGLYQNRTQALQTQISQEETLNSNLQDEYMALQHDRSYVERMARDVLSMGREGETIFKFQPYSGQQGGRVTAAADPKP